MQPPEKENGLSLISREAVRIAQVEIQREARDCARGLCNSIVNFETSHIPRDDCFAAFCLCPNNPACAKPPERHYYIKSDFRIATQNDKKVRPRRSELTLEDLLKRL